MPVRNRYQPQPPVYAPARYSSVVRRHGTRTVSSSEGELLRNHEVDIVELIPIAEESDPGPQLRPVRVLRETRTPHDLVEHRRPRPR